MMGFEVEVEPVTERKCWVNDFYMILKGTADVVM